MKQDINYIPWIHGNIIPPQWYHQILKPSGSPDFVAISILADIIHWHQPSKNNEKKFKADKLQKNYQFYANQLNVSKDTIKKSFDNLQTQNLITREFKTVETPTGLIMNNMMFITPMMNNIKLITINTVTKNSPPPLTQGEAPPLTQGEAPPLTQGEAPPLTGGDIYSNNYIKNNNNDFPQLFSKNEVEPVAVFFPESGRNSCSAHNLNQNDETAKKLQASVSKKFDEPLIKEFIRKIVDEGKYTPQFLESSIGYANDHSTGDIKQYRSYLSKTIDNEWGLGYESKQQKVLKEKEKEKKKFDTIKAMSTESILDEAIGGCRIALQVLEELPTERLKKEYEINKDEAAKFILVKRGVISSDYFESKDKKKEQEQSKIEIQYLPPKKTAEEIQERLKKQKEDLAKFLKDKEQKIQNKL